MNRLQMLQGIRDRHRAPDNFEFFRPDSCLGAVCNPEEVWQMTDEMLIAHDPWLPQYASEIPAALSRLGAHDKNGTRVVPHTGTGAARVKTKTVAEMAKDVEGTRKNAGAADKGQPLNGSINSI